MSAIRHSTFILLALTAAMAGSHAYAEERVWSVSRSSGEVWVASAGAQQTALSADIKPGDTVRTGRNGRVLLVRGEESILVAPNSSIAVPKDGAADGMSTTIIQQAGSILLEVEKRNVKHFEVQTPSLAAVVKGTQFSISVSATGASVNVLRGQVEVAHFKSGQIAQVMPGQTATSFAHGKLGLSLSGSGQFSPIEQGKPRSSPVERLMVPKGGLTAPRQAGTNMQVRAMAQIKAGVAAPVQRAKTSTGLGARRSGIRISSPIGDVRLNFSKVTHGLARGAGPAVGSNRAAASSATIWSSDNSSKGAASVSSNALSANVTSAAASVSAAVASGASSTNPGSADNSSGSTTSGSTGSSSGSDNSGTTSNSGKSPHAEEKGNRGNHGGHDKGRDDHANNGNGGKGDDNGKGNSGKGNGKH